MESYVQENYYRSFICMLQKIIKKVYSMEQDSISNHINIYNTLNTDPHSYARVSLAGYQTGVREYIS